MSETREESQFDVGEGREAGIASRRCARCGTGIQNSATWRGERGPFCSIDCATGSQRSIPAPAPSVPNLSLLTRPPRVGEDVLFVLPIGPRKGEVRPAKILRVYESPEGRVRLAVFVDEGHDGLAYSGSLVNLDAPFSREAEAGSWHRE